MPQLPESAIVRINNFKNSPVGIGFLVSDTHILTCAHVVAQALYGANWQAAALAAETPKETVALDFPLLAPGQPPIACHAAVEAWFPMTGEQLAGTDIAVLRLVEARPGDSQSAPLYSLLKSWKTPVRAFGVPKERDPGKWAEGSLLSWDARGLMIIRDTGETGYTIEPGFSGGPVWSDDLNGVVGMAVLQDNREGVREALMTPAPILHRVLPSGAAPLHSLPASLSTPALRPSLPSKEEWEELLLRECDRYSIMEDFGRKYQHEWTGNSPVLFVLPVGKEDHPKSFVERLQTSELRKIEQERRKFGAAGLPEVIDCLEMKAEIPDAAAASRTSTAGYLQEEIENFLQAQCCRKPAWFILYKTIQDLECRENASGVALFLRALAAACRTHTVRNPEQKLLVFPLIKHNAAPVRKHRPGVLSRLFAFPLRNRAGSEQNGSASQSHCDWCCQVASSLRSLGMEYFELMPLKCVEREDVETWMDACCAPFIPSKAERIEMLKTIYHSSEKECMPMEPLLLECVRSYEAWRRGGHLAGSAGNGGTA